MSEIEIKARYLKLHNNLSDRYYNKHELTLRQFNEQHAQIWNDMEIELSEDAQV